MDPLPAIAAICREHSLWFHVDAAMSGTAALCPEFRHYQHGVEHADSYCFNPHKWMFTNFDCDCFYVADRKALINALSILPEYLKNQATESGWVKKDDRFELVAPVPLNLVCFRYRGSEEENQRLMDRLNRSGDLYFTHTRLGNQFVLRFCVGQTNTTMKHVERAWQRIQEEAAKLESEAR
jgi:aromatic-L-amino-acid decarboxylase